MTTKAIEIDSALIAAEVAHDKAMVIADDLVGDYFGYGESSNDTLVDYKEAALKCRIVHDYLYDLGKKLEELRVLLDT